MLQLTVVSSRSRLLRSLGSLLSCAAISLSSVGCTESGPPPAPAGPVADTVSPKSSPMPYKVLADETNRQANSVEYHVLIGAGQKHDDVQKLLEFLYRHLMKRRDDAPANLAGFVYNDEAQWKTPPRSPIASVLQKPGDIGPAFDNKVPLEFWQQIDEALKTVSKLEKPGPFAKKLVRDDEKKTLTVTQPYNEPGEERWAEQLSYNQAINHFTDITKALFDGVPELASLTFIGTWKDQEVLRISLDRKDYTDADIANVDDQIGQLHGRVYLEAQTTKTTDAKLEKGNRERITGVYKKMLQGLVKAGKVKVAPSLK